jgi:hypothetical protein
MGGQLCTLLACQSTFASTTVCAGRSKQAKGSDGNLGQSGVLQERTREEMGTSFSGAMEVARGHAKWRNLVALSSK